MKHCIAFLIATSVLAPPAPAQGHGPHSGGGQMELTIGFGERLGIELPGLVEEVSWRLISEAEGRSIASGKGTALLEHVFADPGDHLVLIDEHAALDPLDPHPQLPEKLLVRVMPVRTLFDVQGIQFEPALKGNRSLDGTVMRVPVQLWMHGAGPVDVQFPEARAAGVGAEVTLTPNGAVHLAGDARSDVEYVLQGTVRSGTYIMIDLVDPHGRVCSHALPFIIP